MPIYTPELRETKWSEFSCLRKQYYASRDQDLNHGLSNFLIKSLTCYPHHCAFKEQRKSSCQVMTVFHFTGQYAESSNRTCTPCRSLCKQCNPVDPDKCTSCPAGHFLHAHQCLSANQCPVGTYANTATATCENCPIGCASCSHASDLKCLACSEGFVMYKSKCLMRCPEGTFPNNSNRSALDKLYIVHVGSECNVGG